MPDSAVNESAIVQPQSLDTAARERLRQFIARIERLEADKAEVMADLKEVFAEAKGMGYDTKIMRQVVRIRKMDADDRREQESVLDLYLHALGDA
jgi:uncharacterized protein (UPF0335 family)